MEINLAVAENIQRIRKAQKLSIDRTAELAGVSKSMLGQIERGEANPSVAILGKLAKALKVPAETLLENDDFQSLLLTPELSTKPQRLDGGKVVLRQSMPYEEGTRSETSFLDVYISGTYTPDSAVTGSLCTVTMLSGTGFLTVDGETYTLQERDAMRFAADQPWTLRNQGNATVRAMLLWQYRKEG
ncbi:MAG: helix-turn-helix domain-containing protein [Oscillospiraceae bacterium]|nr:helix-turn-helix domain-containing protein [Oscillospiraceae bacterium]